MGSHSGGEEVLNVVITWVESVCSLCQEKRSWQPRRVCMTRGGTCSFWHPLSQVRCRRRSLSLLPSCKHDGGDDASHEVRAFAPAATTATSAMDREFDESANSAVSDWRGVACRQSPVCVHWWVSRVSANPVSSRRRYANSRTGPRSKRTTFFASTRSSKRCWIALGRTTERSRRQRS